MENKYIDYRNIRYKRTYRTIGKMSWWRIVLGVILIVYVLLMSGLVSQVFATREQFVLAEKLMISPEWMEKYKPETKAFIEAGVLYQNDELNEALDAFNAIEDFEAADVMISRVTLKLVQNMLVEKNYDEAFAAIIDVNFGFLKPEETEAYFNVCTALHKHFDAQEGEACQKKALELAELISANS